MKVVWLPFGAKFDRGQLSVVVVGMVLLTQNDAFVLHYFYEIPVQRSLSSGLRTRCRLRLLQSHNPQAAV